MFKAVIFDMDGVLIDSVPSASLVREKLLADYGIDINTVPDPDNDSHKGSSVATFLKAVKDTHDVNIDETQFRHNAGEEIYQNLLARGVSADLALVRLLEELREHDVICAITSSGARKSVTYKLGILGIEHFFRLIVTSDDVTAHKPDPEPYLYTMEQLGFEPGECIVFEDSSAGVQAALAAKVRVIGFTQYTTDDQPLEGVNATVESWDAVSYEYLTKLAGQA